MSKSFEKIILVGISNKSISDAIEQIVKETHQESPVSWFEVMEERGRVTPDGQIEFQVTVNIGRKLK